MLRTFCDWLTSRFPTEVLPLTPRYRRRAGRVTGGIGSGGRRHNFWMRIADSLWHCGRSDRASSVARTAPPQFRFEPPHRQRPDVCEICSPPGSTGLAGASIRRLRHWRQRSRALARRRTRYTPPMRSATWERPSHLSGGNLDRPCGGDWSLLRRLPRIQGRSRRPADGWDDGGEPAGLFLEGRDDAVLSAFQMVQAAAQYQQSVMRLDKWLKLVRGQVKLRPICRGDGPPGNGPGNRPDTQRPAGYWDSAGGGPWRRTGRGGEQGDCDSIHLFGGGPRRGVAARRRGVGAAAPRADWTASRLRHLPDCDHSLSASWMHELLWRELTQQPRDRVTTAVEPIAGLRTLVVRVSRAAARRSGGAAWLRDGSRRRSPRLPSRWGYPGCSTCRRRRWTRRWRDGPGGRSIRSGGRRRWRSARGPGSGASSGGSRRRVRLLRRVTAEVARHHPGCH